MSIRTRRLILVFLSLLLAILPATSAFGQGNGPNNEGTPPPPDQSPRGDAPILGTDAPGAIRDNYIVVFRKDTPPGLEHAAASDVARQHGAAVHFTYSTVLRGFAATLPEQAVKALARNPHVLFIEADMTVALDETQSPATWGLDRIDQ